MIDLKAMGRRAKEASRVLARLTTAQKDAALRTLADALERESATVLAANAADLDAARLQGISDALLDRLSLQGGRLAAIAADVRSVAALPDPVGEIFDEADRPSGLHLFKKRVPLGVLGVIYEARPNVTVDIASLALKTGNAAILRGGSETLRSNRALIDVLQAALAAQGLPGDAVQLIDDPDRAYVGELLTLHESVDMIIPRGGASLHDFCRRNSTIPVIIGGIGICHIYADRQLDLVRGIDVIVNAKTQRPSPCNALDTVLVHVQIAPTLLPPLAAALFAKGVTLHVDDRAAAVLPIDGARVVAVTDADYDTEWMSLHLNVRVVDDLDTALAHIAAHSLGHTDTILTDDPEAAARFLNEVDSAAVFHNASTRLNDGAQFGLGAEVAVSTQKLHARGPMGLTELTTYKWIGAGDYLLRR
jgi:glutamate-5-semialdehyde dehydrogenase